jgi:hypothetical protein
MKTVEPDCQGNFDATENGRFNVSGTATAPTKFHGVR